MYRLNGKASRNWYKHACIYTKSLKWEGTYKRPSFTIRRTVAHPPATHACNRKIGIFVTHWCFFFKELEKNLALDGIAIQSSTYQSSNAQRAIDGKPDANFHHGSCSQTSRENDPWWRVTFKRLLLVKEVTIVNRADCCGELVDGFIFTSYHRHILQLLVRLCSMK